MPTTIKTTYRSLVTLSLPKAVPASSSGISFSNKQKHRVSFGPRARNALHLH